MPVCAGSSTLAGLMTRRVGTIVSPARFAAAAVGGGAPRGATLGRAPLRGAAPTRSAGSPNYPLLKGACV